MILTEEFKTNCTNGQPHEPIDGIHSEMSCKNCGKYIHQTNEGSGYFFTNEDDKKWDKVYNDGTSI